MLKHLSFIAVSVLACTLMDQSSASNPAEAEAAEVIKKFNFASATLPFKTEGLGEPEGLGNAEGGFRWTVQKEATFIAPVIDGESRIQRVVFKNVSALAKPDYTQTLDVLVEDKPAGTQVVFNEAAKIQDVVVEIPSTIKGNLTIKFMMEKATTANVFYPDNTDPRLLALQLRGLELYMKKEPSARICVVQ